MALSVYAYMYMYTHKINEHISSPKMLKNLM